MKIFLISNNSLLEHISYDNTSNLDDIRMSRPLSIEGENIAKNALKKDFFNSVTKIYSSFYSSALSTSKYLSSYLEIPINMTTILNECKVGYLGSKNMKMVKGLQDHEFTYKLNGGESLVEVGSRIDNFIKSKYNSDGDIAIFTHKRAILGYLLKYSKVGYNLDENLILTFEGNVIYDDSEKLLDIYELTIEDNKLININCIN